MAKSSLIYEEWRDVKGYEGLYQVSSFGRIKSLDRFINNPHKNGTYLIHGRFITAHKDKDNYMRVILSKNSHKKNLQVHRLVAEAFIDNPNNYPCVNHKNEFRFDNFVGNLEWCSYRYNSNYGSCSKKKRYKQSNKIIQIDIDTNERIKVWNSTYEAARQLNGTIRAINNCINRKQKTAYGYKWDR